MSDRKENALFRTYDGKPMGSPKVGKLVTKTFSKISGYNPTTTILRSIVETSSDRARLRGKITLEQQAAIHHINAHSGTVARNYYIMQDKKEKVQHANKGFDFMFPDDEPDAYDNDMPGLVGDSDSDDDIDKYS